MTVSQTQTNIMNNSTLLKKINNDAVKIFSHYNSNDSHHIAPTMELYDVFPRCKKIFFVIIIIHLGIWKVFMYVRRYKTRYGKRKTEWFYKPWAKFRISTCRIKLRLVSSDIKQIHVEISCDVSFSIDFLRMYKQNSAEKKKKIICCA